MINNNIKNLLASTLREKSGSYMIEQIFTRFPSLSELMEASEEELKMIPGIGASKATAIISALQLAKAMQCEQIIPTIIKSPRDAYECVKSDLMYQQREHFIAIFLNTKNAVIAKEIISIGSLNAAIVHPRELFRAAIKRAAASIICAHQHPSGDPTPSQEDIQLTIRLMEAGEIIGIEVLDHIVLGHDQFVSLKELGMI
ncbi:RadC family protein [Paenibacillus sp. FSL H8-0034]|uniref:RadC family protein n=1 Tax=Paenibacillus sp. FSL H8-0034 TaxID=2954671 RepID=UPI0030F83DE4